ncbi:MAG: hypothetical protein AB7T06_25455 [Kofleriaceae bacterium]
MKNLNYILLASSLALAGACVQNELEDGSVSNPPPSGGTSSGEEENTFDHMNDGISPWELVDRLSKEGPPRYTSHVHSCSKIRYATLGNVLRSVGVNVANMTALSAGRLYQDGFSALGGPNFENRIRENIGISTSGASREFDIFAAAAPEVIAAIPTLARCQVAGTPAVLFDANDTCQASGITCLIGSPATQAHIDICNASVTGATTPDIGKRLAVAVLLAAAHTCE